MTKGFTDAAQRMRTRARLLRAEQGGLWRDQSQHVQNAIVDHTDASYHGSPALQMAVNSALNWQHAPQAHLLRILSTAYANYRQYGCGGIPIVPLVTITEGDRQRMTERFAQVLHEAR